MFRNAFGICFSFCEINNFFFNERWVIIFYCMFKSFNWNSCDIFVFASFYEIEIVLSYLFWINKEICLRQFIFVIHSKNYQFFFFFILFLTNDKLFMSHTERVQYILLRKCGPLISQYLCLFHSFVVFVFKRASELQNFVLLYHIITHFYCCVYMSFKNIWNSHHINQIHFFIRCCCQY